MKKTMGWLLLSIIVCTGIFFVSQNKQNTSTENTEGMGELASTATIQEQQQVIDKMNKEILAIKNRSEVKSTAQKILKMASDVKDKKYPIVEIYAAVANFVPLLEGIIYRCRSFIEKTDWMHASILFGFRDFKYNNYLYGSHVDALFDYLTYPSNAAGEPFESISKLQDYLLFQVAPRLEGLMKLIVELEKQPSENFEFQFDRTLLVGKKDDLRFIDREETEKLFIKPYFYTLTFLVQRALGTIYYVGAMDLDEMPIVFNRVLKKTTLNNFAGNLRLGDPVKGVTPEMTYEIIKSKEIKSFLKWRQKVSSANGKSVQVQELLDRAFYYGQVSASYQLSAYVCGLKYAYQRSRGQIMQINNRASECSVLDQVGNTSSYFITSGDKYLFNPNSMILNFKKKSNMFRDRVRAYQAASTDSYATITSDVTGKPLDVNIKAFFKSNVSQRDFLPTGYTNIPAKSPSSIAGVDSWHYDHGKPMEFADYSFNGFFNKGKVKDTQSLYEAMTTLLYTDAIAPFAIFIRVPSTVRYFTPPGEIIRQ